MKNKIVKFLKDEKEDRVMGLIGILVSTPVGLYMGSTINSAMKNYDNPLVKGLTAVGGLIVGSIGASLTSYIVHEKVKELIDELPYESEEQTN